MTLRELEGQLALSQGRRSAGEYSPSLHVPQPRRAHIEDDATIVLTPEAAEMLAELVSFDAGLRGLKEVGA